MNTVHQHFGQPLKENYFHYMLTLSSGKITRNFNRLTRWFRLCCQGSGMPNRLPGLFLWLLLPAVCLAGPIYVSPLGNDAWTGALPDPKTGANTGPKKTLTEALRVARLLHAAVPAPTAPVVIILRGGTYELADTVTLTPADSGTSVSPLIIQAQANEAPILSGGTNLAQNVQSASLWTTSLPVTFQGSPFSQLYVAGGRRQRVKMPKTGYYQVAGSVNPSNATVPDAFRYAAGDVSTGARVDELVVRAFQKWSVYTLQVAQIDPTTRTITFNTPMAGRPRVPFDDTSWYILENVSNAPLALGEWYLDRTALVVRYSPRLGEIASASPLVAPRLETLLSMQGVKGTGAKVQNVSFQGITFAYTDWKLPAAGLRSIVGAVLTPGTVEVSSARDISFTGCTFRATGAYGLVLGADVQRGSVTNSVFNNIGAGGIRIGSSDPNDLNVPAQWTSNCTIQNNIVTAYGQVHPDGVGIWVGYAGGTDIEHNEVTNGYYSGIFVGWVEGYGIYAAHDNIVRQNRIWHLGQNVLSDLGGIYTLGEQPGTQVTGNVVSDVQGARYGGWGIYCDEGSSSILVENNLAFNFSASAMHVHWGRDLIIQGNIFALGHDNDFENTCPGQTGSFSLYDNVFVTKQAPYYGINGLNSNVLIDDNSYVTISGGTKLFPDGTDLTVWQQREPHAAVLDPGFRNPQAGDFTPAHPEILSAMGIDMSMITKAGRISGPGVKFVQGKWWDPAPGTQSIAFTADFDVNGADDLFAFAPSIGAVGQDIKVSSEQCHSAPNSLKFTDGPLGQAWQPLASRMVYITDGYVHVSLWLWATKGSVPWVALRDANLAMTSIVNGPVVTVNPDGNLTAGDLSAMPLPSETWCKLDITFGIGSVRTATWSLVVTPDGSAAKTFVGMPMPKNFVAFDWLGIAAYGNTVSTFYVDDINVAVAAKP